MRRPFIAGNWKMHKTIPEAIDFARSLAAVVVGRTHCDIALAPSFTALKVVADVLEGTSIQVASQDVAAEPGSGAYTGEVSAFQVKDAGAAYAIIGHSERRQFYGETDRDVNRKIEVSIDAGLVPILCVGEGLDDRKLGNAERIVGGQLAAGLHNLTVQEASRIIIAYEPVWAIGTGYTATPQVAEEMHGFIRSRIREVFGDEAAEELRVLYGGSVKADNITALMEEPDIDGALVGGASLQVESFARIINYSDSEES
jgi:triosephosphate isomerase